MTGPETIPLLRGEEAPPGYIEPSGSGFGVKRYAIRRDVYERGLLEADKQRQQHLNEHSIDNIAGDAIE
jgi:hypothetical protein